MLFNMKIEKIFFVFNIHLYVTSVFGLKNLHFFKITTIFAKGKEKQTLTATLESCRDYYLI